MTKEQRERIAKKFDVGFEAWERAIDREEYEKADRCEVVIRHMDDILQILGYERICEGEKQVIVRR